MQCVVFSRWPWWRRVDRGEAISKNKPPGSPTDLQFFRGFQSEVPGSSHPLEMSRLQKSSEFPKTAVQSGDRDGSGHCNLRDIAGSEATVDWLPVSGRISGRRDGVKRARTGIAGTEHIAVFGESPLRNLGILSTQDLAVPGSPNFGTCQPFGGCYSCHSCHSCRSCRSCLPCRVAFLVSTNLGGIPPVTAGGHSGGEETERKGLRSIRRWTQSPCVEVLLLPGGSHLVRSPRPRFSSISSRVYPLVSGTTFQIQKTPTNPTSP